MILKASLQVNLKSSQVKFFETFSTLKWSLLTIATQKTKHFLNVLIQILTRLADFLSRKTEDLALKETRE